ncbi:MAG TPA: hypothetical protein VMU19_12555 [Bryobacteraceae bacterium]|nr:hypothetical protein [Bryobacteraceae bacterium]
MFRTAALGLLALSLLHAGPDSKQAPKAPPAKSDRELRARATQFFEDFVNANFTDAEKLVAPESKNVFISGRKEQYQSCELQRVDYSADFHTADVEMQCVRNIMIQGFAGAPIKYPLSTQWKLEHGKWFWFVDPTAPRGSPFGVMNAMISAMNGAKAAEASPPVTLPSAAQLSSPSVAMNKVRADKQALSLKAGQSADLVLSNTALGPMSFTLDVPPPAGYEVSPAHADMKENSKTTVTVKALEGAKPAVLNFRVSPTGEVVSVKVDIQ